MEEDIKKTMNVICGFYLIFFFTRAIVARIVQYFNENANLMVASFVWMTIIILIPSIHLLKISPLRSNGDLTNKASKFEIIIIILLSWALYRIIVLGSIQIPLIYRIVVPSDDSSNILFDHSSLIVSTLRVLFALIVEELIFRGVLLNKLRKYGDIFAVVVSAVVFSLVHYSTFFVVIFAGLFLGMVYVISNSIGATIILHALVNLGNVFVEGYVLKGDYNTILMFYAIIIVICLIIMILDKRFRKSFIEHRSKYKEEADQYKGRYSVVLKSEGFLAFFMFTGIYTALIVSNII